MPNFSSDPPSPSDSRTHPDPSLSLRYGQFRLTLIPEAPLRLPPYPGSLFRGAFGWALQRVICVTRTHDCPPCFLRDRCLFPYIFDTPPPATTEIMRKYTAAPHPFILTPPFPSRGTITPGEPLHLDLTLIGKSLASLPYFVFAFERLGQTGLGKRKVKYTLSSVATYMDGQSWMLYAAPDRVLQPGQVFERPLHVDLSVPRPGHASPSRRVHLEWVSPLRLVFQGRLVDQLEFHMLVRTLLRRLAHLSYFHCGGSTHDLPFREWIDAAHRVRTVSHNLEWFDWERYSNRQQTSMRLGGLLGSITFEGPVDPFLPLLQAGEITHVGKGTSFGLGRYRVDTTKAVSSSHPD